MPLNVFAGMSPDGCAGSRPEQEDILVVLAVHDSPSIA